MNGTSWLLGGGYPWYSGSPAAEQPGIAPSAVVANERTGLSLATLSEGALGLASPDDSLGQLTPPRGVATETEAAYVLSRDGALVYRFDSLHMTLTPLEHIGAQGLGPDADDASFLEPRRFRGASSIAVLHGTLYVADRAAHRVQVFDLRTLALIRIHAKLGNPADLAAGRDGVYILDRSVGRVYRAAPGMESLQLVIDAAADGDADLTRRTRRARYWDRIAVDTAERIYLRYHAADVTELDVFVLGACVPLAQPSEHIRDSAQVRDRFAPAAITMDATGALVLPDSLLDPCGLRRPLAPSVPRWEVAGRLYVADPASRKLRVYLPDGRLRHQFGPLDADGNEVPPDDPRAWAALDLAVLGQCAVVLDERHQTVYGHRAGEGALFKVFRAPADLERTWRRIADDGSGCLLLWDGVADRVDRLDLRGQHLGEMPLRAVRARFDRSRSTRQPAPDRGRVRMSRSGASIIPHKDRPSWPEPRYEQHGVWTSQWLDSRLYDCPWHVIELADMHLPPGSSLHVRTRTSNSKESATEVAATASRIGAGGDWRDTPVFTAPAQPDPKAPQCMQHDVLVPSGPGQFLQLQIVLGGNGSTTPVLGRVRLRFPRESLLQYLPAIYSSPPEQREFLERFLSVMQTTWSSIEHELESFERYVDPDSVPPQAMSYLAGWLDLRLEGSWGPAQNRRLLQAMPRLRARWGTTDGLRDWLRVHLANLGGIEPEVLAELEVPAIVEGFVERRRLRLADGGAVLGAADGLWSPAVERRFQVGVFDREGEIELVSTGDIQTDVFRHHAHSFRVYVPAALVRTADDEALVRRAIEAQKPAHTMYELVLFEPRLRIGEQSTVGLDTVIGAPFPGPLACPGITDAPSRPLHQRLNFDVMLGCDNACGDESRLERSLP